MYGTLDINVNLHDETDTWHVTPQTLVNVDDANEDPDQSTFDGNHYTIDEDEPEHAKHQALNFAKNLGEYAVKTGQTKQAVVFLNGNEKFYITPGNTTDRDA
jgi:hypothetical protein